MPCPKCQALLCPEIGSGVSPSASSSVSDHSTGFWSGSMWDAREDAVLGATHPQKGPLLQGERTGKGVVGIWASPAVPLFHPSICPSIFSSLLWPEQAGHSASAPRAVGKAEPPPPSSSPHTPISFLLSLAIPPAPLPATLGSPPGPTPSLALSLFRNLPEAAWKEPSRSKCWTGK